MVSLQSESLDELFDIASMLSDEPKKNAVDPKEEPYCCDNQNIVVDHINGMFVCNSCGCVTDDTLIDQSAEWNFGPDDAMFGKDPSRCGCPINPLLEKSSMATTISRTKGAKNWLMIKLHQQNSMDYVERARYHIFEKIARMAQRQELAGQIVEDAKAMYKTISEQKLSRGNVRLGLLACCIMHACKLAKVPRSAKEIAEMCEIDISVLNNATKIFYTIIPDIVQESHVGPDDLIIRFCNCLGLEKSEEKTLVRRVRELYNEHRDSHFLVGKTPSAITSAFVYKALSEIKENVNKKFLCQQHKISVVTLNKILNIINEK